MEKRTWLALLAVLGLAGVAVLLFWAPQKGEKKGDRPRPVSAIRAADVVALDVTGADGKAVSLKKEGGWRVVSPWNKPADQAAVDMAVQNLEKMQWRDVVSQSKDQHAELEVSDDKAVHVVAKNAAGQVVADLYLGKSTDLGTMVRPAGKQEVWRAADITRSVFQKQPKEWRNAHVFEEKAARATRVVLMGDDATVVLDREAAEDKNTGPTGADIYNAKWKVTAGGTDGLPKTTVVAAGRDIDHALVNRLVGALADLKADDFVDDAKPEQWAGMGFAAADKAFTQTDSAMVVRVFFQGDKSIALRIGTGADGKTLAQATQDGPFFSLASHVLQSLQHVPRDVFSPKTLVDLKADDLSRVLVQQAGDKLVLERAGDAWKAAGVANSDEARIKAVADAFQNVVGEASVSVRDPALKALAASKETVTLVPKKGAAITLIIGPQRDNRRVVQKKGSPDAWWVPSYVVDRMLKKPADLRR